VKDMGFFKLDVIYF